VDAGPKVTAAARGVDGLVSAAMTNGTGPLGHVVVVGASLAGLRACETLRTDGFTGRITLVGAEREMPYDRPPLSKKLLSGEWEPDRIVLRKPDDVTGLGLETMLGVRASGLDTERRHLQLDDGSELAYDGLVIATGAAPRRLPGQPDLDGICVLRTLADALDLRARLTEPGTRLVVIGAGFIGLEAAATARDRGCTVTVLEGLPSPLVRGLGEQLGAAWRACTPATTSRSVVVCRWPGSREPTAGSRASGSPMARSWARTWCWSASGSHRRSTGWRVAGSSCATASCATTGLSTGVPGVYAAGDCVRWHNRVFDPHDDAVMRVEHWTNAAEQGAAAARNLLRASSGEPSVPYESVPFFWSDQFESRIQFVGRAHGGDEVHVFAGSTDGAFAALYGWEGRLRGVLGVSMPKMVMPFRGLIAGRASWAEALEKAMALTTPA
jgi:NADPH-dependent 2,4-dienoyl-CoA reductase/sulfur reductase-like enzyme